MHEEPFTDIIVRCSLCALRPLEHLSDVTYSTWYCEVKKRSNKESLDGVLGTSSELTLQAGTMFQVYPHM